MEASLVPSNGSEHERGKGSGPRWARGPQGTRAVWLGFSSAGCGMADLPQEACVSVCGIDARGEGQNGLR